MPWVNGDAPPSKGEAGSTHAYTQVHSYTFLSPTEVSPANFTPPSSMYTRHTPKPLFLIHPTHIQTSATPPPNTHTDALSPVANHSLYQESQLSPCFSELLFSCGTDSEVQVGSELLWPASALLSPLPQWC